MAVREIRLFGDPVLKTQSVEINSIDGGIKALVTDLLDTTALPGRAGVAAPQIGVNLRAFSYNVNGTIGYILNPEIVELGGDVVLVDEGCLSVPGIYDGVERATQVKVKALDEHGHERTIEADGLLAVCIQHELDHLMGKVFVEYLSPLKRNRIKTKLLKAQRDGD